MTRNHLHIAVGFWLASTLAGQSIQFQGSVPAGTASDTPLELKLDDAIQRGLQTNLGLLSRDTSSQTTRAERIRALSTLLPQVNGTFGETREQLDLQTIGFNFKFPPIPGFAGIPTVSDRFPTHRLRQTYRQRFSIGALGETSARPRPMRQRPDSLSRMRAIWSYSR